jgi:hypothetical protein
VSFVVIFNSASKEPDISYLGGFWRLTKQNMLICMLLLLTCIAIFCRIPLNIYEKIFAVSFAVVVSSVFRRVFFSRPCNNDTIISGAKNAGLFYILPILFVCGWFLWQTQFWKYDIFYWLLLIAILSLVILPSLKIDAFGHLGVWQNNFLSKFYEAIFIRPLKLFGRILWLAFDVMVVERSVIASISHLSKTTVSVMHKVQENSKYSYLLSALIGIMILVIYFLRIYINE